MKQLFIFAAFINCLFSQTLEVELNNLTTLDEEFIHVVIFKDSPSEKLILPEEISLDKYFKLFYSWESENDEIVSVAVIQNDSADILYVDLNNDEDLTNDGVPIVFPLSQNSLWFDVLDQKDMNQKARLVLYRKPDFPDSIQNKFIDKDGNLLKPLLRYIGAEINHTEFEGGKRTFFFDGRMSLRRGELNIEGTPYKIGLFDYSNNGKFNDDNDLLIIDINKDGKLDYQHDEDIFNLNDIISIHNKNFKISNIDTYGLRIVLEETAEESTKYFTYWDEISYSDQKYKLDQDIWESKFTDLNDNPIYLKEFKGKYILLNFWGEWCLPCREEIPHLIKSRDKYSSKLVFISFLKTSNLNNAREFIKLNNMDWIQIKLTNELEEKFKVQGYPTNLLIFPDGVTFLRQSVVHEDYFNKYIR